MGRAPPYSLVLLLQDGHGEFVPRRRDVMSGTNVSAVDRCEGLGPHPIRREGRAAGPIGVAVGGGGAPARCGSRGGPGATGGAAGTDGGGGGRPDGGVDDDGGGGGLGRGRAGPLGVESMVARVGSGGPGRRRIARGASAARRRPGPRPLRRRRPRRSRRPTPTTGGLDSPVVDRGSPVTPGGHKARGPVGLRGGRGRRTRVGERRWGKKGKRATRREKGVA